MADLIVVAIVMLIVGAAVLYIRKEKKRGVRCVGCPAGGTCAHRQGNGSGCSCGGNCGHE